MALRAHARFFTSTLGAFPSIETRSGEWAASPNANCPLIVFDQRLYRTHRYALAAVIAEQGIDYIGDLEIGTLRDRPWLTGDLARTTSKTLFKDFEAHRTRRLISGITGRGSCPDRQLRWNVSCKIK